VKHDWAWALTTLLHVKHNRKAMRRPPNTHTLVEFVAARCDLQHNQSSGGIARHDMQPALSLCVWSVHDWHQLFELHSYRYDSVWFVACVAGGIC
jgi:hypothetical protein